MIRNFVVFSKYAPRPSDARNKRLSIRVSVQNAVCSVRHIPCAWKSFFPWAVDIFIGSPSSKIFSGIFLGNFQVVGAFVETPLDSWRMVKDGECLLLYVVCPCGFLLDNGVVFVAFVRATRMVKKFGKRFGGAGFFAYIGDIKNKKL